MARSPRHCAGQQKDPEGGTSPRVSDFADGSCLVIERTDGGAALAAGVAGLSAGGRQFTLSPAETILVEGGTVFRAPEKSD